VVVAGRVADARFQTERLMLRPLRANDVDLLFELNSDPEVMQYITGRPSTLDEVRAEVADALGCRWIAIERASDEAIGWVGAIPSKDGAEYDVGWRLRRAVWGGGLATEAAVALIDRLFDAGASRVFAQTMAVNNRSRAVMRRCGMLYRRTLHLSFDDPLPGTELGEVEYELTRERWLRQRDRA
jgi:RimJ/RimL family protein N-acetyltransferase